MHRVFGVKLWIATKNFGCMRLRMIVSILVISHTSACSSDLLTVSNCRRHEDEAKATEQMEWRMDIVWRRPDLASTQQCVKEAPQGRSSLLCHVFTVDAEHHLITQSFCTVRWPSDLQPGASSNGKWLQSSMRVFSRHWGWSKVRRTALGEGKKCVWIWVFLHQAQ